MGRSSELTKQVQAPIEAELWAPGCTYAMRQRTCGAGPTTCERCWTACRPRPARTQHSCKQRGRRTWASRWPRPAQKLVRTVGIKPRLLMDHAEYALGLAEKEGDKHTTKRHEAFEALVQAVATFLGRHDPATFQASTWAPSTSRRTV